MSNIAEFTSGFWSGWVILLTVLGLAFVCGLLWTSARGRHIRAEKSVWDETLREGDSPPPQWWFALFLVLIIFSCAYLVLYPGLGGYRGTLGWTQYKQYEQAREYYDERFGAAREKWRAASFAEIAADDSAMRTASVLFAENCAGCHGRDGRGQANMFPDLTSGAWQWGGDEQSVYTSVAQGRRALMPPQTAILGGEEQVRAMAAYVQNRLRDADTPAAAKFAQVCAVCHGAEGKGNPLLGAPDLTDDVWLYGGDQEALMESLTRGRGGVMPAQLERLGEARSRLLAAWLATGKIKEFAPR